MQKLISIVVVFFPLLLSAQTGLSLGKGILKIDISKLPMILFYTDTTERKPLKTVEVVKDANGEVVIKNREEIDTWFKPEQLFLEYDIFMLRVDTIKGEWLKVYINNENGKAMWTKAAASQRFIEWPKFLLKEISAIDKHPLFNLDIKALPSEKSNTIKKIESADCFEVLEIKGDWMHIKTNLKGECNESKKIIRSGWIRWNQKNKLTINYSLMA
ncbi:MAG: hypothetical protein ABIN67_06080 [Ferruginibacter sp.]